MTMFVSNRDGDGMTDEQGHYKFQTSVFSGNVLESDDLAVTQNSPLGLSVLVAPGQFKIDTADGYSYTGWNTASISTSISTPDPANPRITSIVLYLDKGAPTAASPPNNPGIAKIIAVNGTPGAVPSVPNSTAIQTAIGAGNPYTVLANVTVGAEAVNIVDANISDQRVPVTISTNMISNTSLKDNAVSTAKVQDSAVSTAKIANLAATTQKVKPNFSVVNGNNGGSRQTFPASNTTYPIVGTSISYTSGPTNEVLDIEAKSLINVTGAGGQFYIAVNSTPVSKSHYLNPAGSHYSASARCLYSISANTTVTIDARVRTAGTGGGEVCNSSSDQSGSPSFGSQLLLVAWGRT